MRLTNITAESSISTSARYQKGAATINLTYELAEGDDPARSLVQAEETARKAAQDSAGKSLLWAITESESHQRNIPPAGSRRPQGGGGGDW